MTECLSKRKDEPREAHPRLKRTKEALQDFDRHNHGSGKSENAKPSHDQASILEQGRKVGIFLVHRLLRPC